jgi:hypothetical protein
VLCDYFDDVSCVTDSDYSDDVECVTDSVSNDMLKCNKTKNTQGQGIKSAKFESIAVTLLNARSVKTVNKNVNKLAQLQNLAYVSESHVIGITETWLTESVNDSEILSDNYVLYRRDRQDKRGGGILLAVKNSCNSSLVKILPSQEILTVSVKCIKKNVLFILCYRPPADNTNDFTECLYDLLLTEHNKYDSICLIGDFNFPNIIWTDHDYHGFCEIEKEFINCLNDFNLIQMNNVLSNTKSHILDLVISNTPELFSEVANANVDFNTDHTVLSFTLKAVSKVKHKKRYVYNYKAADFKDIKEQLTLSHLTEIVSNSDSVNDAWNKWYKTVINIVENNVPKVCVKHEFKLPWSDKEVKHLSNKKMTFWRKYKRSKSKKHYIRFKQLRKKTL